MEKKEEKTRREKPMMSRFRRAFQTVAGIFLVYIGTSAEDPLKTILFMGGLIVALHAIARD